MLSNILNSKYRSKLSEEKRRKFSTWYHSYRAEHPGEHALYHNYGAEHPGEHAWYHSYRAEHAGEHAWFHS